MNALRTWFWLPVLCLLGLGCSFSPSLGNSSDVPCLADGSCQVASCVCLSGKVCVPADPLLPAAQCRACGADADCDDGLDCTSDSCDTLSGTCANVPGVEDTAVIGSCENGLDDDCDGNADGADPDCACVDCSCETVADCSGGNFCTVPQCTNNSCRYDDLPLGVGCPGQDDDLCTSTCDGLGSCRNDTPLLCDDGNDCTLDRCEPSDGSCAYQDRPDGASCPGGDDDWCNSSCRSGICSSQYNALADEPCLDAFGCTMPDACDGQGACKAGPALDDMCLPGDVCLPACATMDHGCLKPPDAPGLVCHVGLGASGERVATCYLNLGLAGQAGCLSCAANDPAAATVGPLQETQAGEYAFLVHENMGNPGTANLVAVTCVWGQVRDEVSVSVSQVITFSQLSLLEDFEGGANNFVYLDDSTWLVDSGELSQGETCIPVNLAILDEAALFNPSATVKVRVDEVCPDPGGQHTLGLLAHVQTGDPPTCASTRAYLCGLDLDENKLFGAMMDNACVGNYPFFVDLPPLVVGAWYEIGIQVQNGFVTCFFEPSDPANSVNLTWASDVLDDLPAGAVGVGVGKVSASFDDLYIEYSPAP